jgi:hypothetical protein
VAAARAGTGSGISSVGAISSRSGGTCR